MPEDLFAPSRSLHQPRSHRYALYCHSGWVHRALASLTDDTAPCGCDPADDHMLEYNAELHVDKYGEELSAERIMFKQAS